MTSEILLPFNWFVIAVSEKKLHAYVEIIATIKTEKKL